MPPDTEEREQLFFERFCALRPELAPKDPVHSDAPDFLFSLHGETIGFEITSFSPALPDGVPPYEDQKSLHARVMETARARYEAHDGPPLHVQALFLHHSPLSKRRVSALADDLVAFLLARADAVPAFAGLPIDIHEAHPHLEEIGHLSAMRVPAPDYGVWYAGLGGWVRYADQADFERVLAAKTPRLASYRTRCDRVWLLIVFEVLGGDTHTEGPRLPLTFTVMTDFDRVFTLDNSVTRCVEIPVSRVAIKDV